MCLYVFNYLGPENTMNLPVDHLGVVDTYLCPLYNDARGVLQELVLMAAREVGVELFFKKI